MPNATLSDYERRLAEIRRQVEQANKELSEILGKNALAKEDTANRLAVKHNLEREAADLRAIIQNLQREKGNLERDLVQKQEEVQIAAAKYADARQKQDEILAEVQKTIVLEQKRYDNARIQAAAAEDKQKEFLRVHAEVGALKTEKVLIEKSLKEREEVATKRELALLQLEKELTERRNVMTDREDSLALYQQQLEKSLKSHA